ncbi:MAG: hypothetical protein NWT02_10740 [Opitutales bacterium]|jgi:hypothetical protein|nr:hypothetical protein [Opitutales bacterium]MDP4643687.1 hypothetical protein [Opitutales bacterium]MDP4777474.1 hypothetical protein [Opitutales bacterium]MDP4884190.1 hypothetical protein [Opitutales bacterium]MDP5079531.1 hypothetical protein [Opitutales bacterium]
MNSRKNAIAGVESPTPPSVSQTKLWQWPNVLAIDAAMIAVIWQSIFAQSIDFTLTIAAQIVLGLSVWLTYMADRLFDVQQRKPEQLLSLRHRFAAKYRIVLWRIWSVALITNIALAFTMLEREQLMHGFYLLAACLTYTALNQKLSKRFFPKEVCVAMIFAGGVLVFLPASSLWPTAGSLALLCLMNCLMIGRKENTVDSAMEVRSLSRNLHPSVIGVVALCTFISLLAVPQNLLLSLVIPLMALNCLSIFHKTLSSENYRVLADGALLLGFLVLF